MGKAAKLKQQRRQLAVEGALQERDIIDLYTRLAPQVIYKHFREDCCLNATRVLIEVMASFGIQVKALATRTMAMNAEMWRRVKAKNDFPDSPAEMDEWVAGGAWAVGIDGKPVEGQPGYPWHVIGVTKHWLIDSSARQMSRPLRNIVVDDVMVINGITWAFSGGARPLVAEAENGVVVSYTAMPDIKTYESIPGFQRSTWNLDVARNIVHLITMGLRRDPA